MNNRIKNKSNKNVHFKSNSNNIKEETKNSVINTKNHEQVNPTKANLNKKKNMFYKKKPKNNIGINLQKLIINSKKKSIISNNSPQQDQINRNLSFNSVILQNKNYVKNYSQSILPKANNQEAIKNKNLKQSNNEIYKSNIIKGKTYFIRNLDITEVFDNSINSINKLNNNNNSILINCITPKNQKAKLRENNNKLIFKNNSFINNNNVILIPGHKIKNCYTNLIINKNDSSSNKLKNKAKGIPFSLKKNRQKIESNTSCKNTQTEKNDKIERIDTQQDFHCIYKNEIILHKKEIIGNKISYKQKFISETSLTDKNINNNLKGSFCSNDIINKKVKSAIQKGCNIDKSNQGMGNSNENSLKIVRKLDMDEELKKDEDHAFIDLKKGKNIKLPNKKFKKNLIINSSKINQNNEKSDFIKNESFINVSSERYNKLKEKIIIRNNLNKNRIIKENNNNIINDSKIEQKNLNDEDTDTIEDSLKDLSNINDIHVFQTSNISLLNSMKNSYIEFEFEKVFSLENITEIIIKFCDLKAINKLCLLCKKYYQYIKPIILKIIRIKVFNYNKNANNKYKNKIKTSLFNYSSLSSKSNFLLEKKYKDLLFENNTAYDEQIKKDLTRTLPDNKSFQYGNSNYNKLYHILTAYSNYNKNIGYVQGLNFLAANSIFAFEKEIDEFLFLDALIQKFKLEDFFGVSNNLSIKLEGINNFLNKYIINIKNHLNKLHLNYEFFITGWVLTLFSNSMDNKYLFYVWDYMIIFGWDYFNCFVIAVLKKYENDILSLPLNKLTFYMKNILRNKLFKFDFENIIKTSFDYLLIEKGIKKDKNKII